MLNDQMKNFDFKKDQNTVARSLSHARALFNVTPVLLVSNLTLCEMETRSNSLFCSGSHRTRSVYTQPPPIHKPFIQTVKNGLRIIIAWIFRNINQIILI